MRGLYSSTNLGEALYGRSTAGNAIVGISTSNLGMYAVSQAASAGILAEGGYIGAQGTATGTDANRQGVRGEINTSSGGGYAGIFVGGTTFVSGTLQKSAGSFIIDHPVEPESKYLVHSFVESPDMKNIYDGVVTTDASGFATVKMPDWFDALNTDFRYQLTCIGQFAQAIIFKEITGQQFIIQTDKPMVKVSWQVTGIRNDPYARDKRLPVVTKGTLLFLAFHPGRPNSLFMLLTPPTTIKSSSTSWENTGWASLVSTSKSLLTLTLPYWKSSVKSRSNT